MSYFGPLDTIDNKKKLDFNPTTPYVLDLLPSSQCQQFEISYYMQLVDDNDHTVELNLPPNMVFNSQTLKLTV